MAMAKIEKITAHTAVSFNIQRMVNCGMRVLVGLSCSITLLSPDLRHEMSFSPSISSGFFRKTVSAHKHDSIKWRQT